jgi:hypothetical protein
MHRPQQHHSDAQGLKRRVFRRVVHNHGNRQLLGARQAARLDRSHRRQPVFVAGCRQLHRSLLTYLVLGLFCLCTRSLLTYLVVANAIEPSLSWIYGPGLTYSEAGLSSKFYVQTRDMFGNNMTFQVKGSNAKLN